MSPARWQEIEKLYHSALEQSPEDRQPFLESACAGDETLRCELEALLAADHDAANFLETKQPEATKITEPVRIPAGAQIGPYVILKFLSAGGMGEVYKARDTRLGRTVAMKFLSASIATDPAAFERFRHEARAASALNHPRICTVFDVGDYEGRPFIVMEFLEGGFLRDVVIGKPLPVPDLVHIAMQICEALQEAHAKGIVHRDVKPANISISAAGEIKILDFGLAKVGWEYYAKGSPRAVESETAGASTLLEFTRPGTLIGTLGYLSPEQARGENVDSRTDIFSLGVVMYEMATGRRPFYGNTSAELVNAILVENPQKPSEINGTVPERLDRIIQKALSKEREARYHSAQDLAADLAVLAAPSRRGFRLAVSVLATAALALVIWVAAGSDTSPRPQAVTQLTHQPGEEVYPSLAPDGKSFVYQSRAAGKWGIYSKRAGGQNPILLSKDSAADDIQPSFSPDGERVAFRSERDGGGIFVMGATGENIRRLTTFGYNPTWSPDGKEVVCSTGYFVRPEERPTPRAKLFRVDVATGETHAISGIDDAVQPGWSPHGYRIAYWSAPKGARDIWTVSARGGDALPVTNDVALDWSPVWSRDGRFLYFSSDRGGSMNLWRVRIDERSGKKLAPPEPVTTPAQYSGLMSFSQDGRRMAYVAQTRDLNLYKVAFDPNIERTNGAPVPVTQGSKPLADPAFSPDGRWIVFNPHLMPQNLYVVGSDGSGVSQLTYGDYMDRCPRWSPDGHRIMFNSNRTGSWQVYTVKPDGSDLKRHTDAPGSGARLPKWAPDGTRLLYMTDGEVVIIDSAKAWKDQTLLTLPNPESGTRFKVHAWSPDGRKLVGELFQKDGGPLGLTVYHLDSQTYERMGPEGAAPVARWLLDSRRVLFRHDGKIHLIDTRTKQIHPVFSPGTRRDVLSFGLSTDGRWIAYTVEAAEADVWLVNLE